MTSRERVLTTLDHREPDCVPLDLGATPVTGMHVSSVYRLRQALGLDAPGTPVKVIEPVQMLGEIGLDLADALGVDTVGLWGPNTNFGFPLDNWKPWTFFDGTPLLVPGGFNTEPAADGSLYMYPQGDRSVAPSARMPRNGFYFDALPRQSPLDEHALRPEDNVEEYRPVDDQTLAYFAAEAQRLYQTTDKAVVGIFGGMSFGDVARIPGVGLKYPRGIRDVEEWYISLVTRPNLVEKIFELQCRVALDNLERIHAVVGDRIQVLYVTGADFGTQSGPLMSVETYRRLFQPVHRAINDWVHRHTNWRTFIHSCGAVAELIPEFIAAGFDILNPVQTSAANMEPRMLKERFGDVITFWGGGVDTQKTLPFGTPEDVHAEVWERLRVFSPGGGYVFNPVHNVQAGVPVHNLLAMYATVQEWRRKQTC